MLKKEKTVEYNEDYRFVVNGTNMNIFMKIQSYTLHLLIIICYLKNYIYTHNVHIYVYHYMYTQIDVCKNICGP